MSTQYVKMTVNLPTEVSLEASVICQEIGMARNAFVCMAVREYLAKYKREKLEILEIEEKLRRNIKSASLEFAV
jgi:metal-responsive CopG/Arc/MetJ family transcriptional regulator